MIKDIYFENLESLEMLYTGISPEEKVVDKELLVNNFMDKSFEIGIYGSEHLQSEEFTAYIKSSQVQVEDARLWIEFYIKNIDRIMNFSFLGNEWKEICKKRSALQFVIDFYVNLYLDNDLIKALDDRIVAVGEKEGGLSSKDIPKHIPDAHYWWFV